MTFDWVVKAIGAGAIGLAAVMLVLSHRSFLKLLAVVGTAGWRGNPDTLRELTSELKDYRKAALIALAASIFVQLAEPIVRRQFPPANNEYNVTLTVEPTADLQPNEMPVVKKAGRRVDQADDRAYIAKIAGDANFSVDIERVNTSIRDLRKLGVALAQSQVVAAQPSDPDKRQLGFEPAP
jgi:hypothetical protein